MFLFFALLANEILMYLTLLLQNSTVLSPHRSSIYPALQKFHFSPLNFTQCGLNNCADDYNVSRRNVRHMDKIQIFRKTQKCGFYVTIIWNMKFTIIPVQCSTQSTLRHSFHLYYFAPSGISPSCSAFWTSQKPLLYLLFMHLSAIKHPVCHHISNLYIPNWAHLFVQGSPEILVHFIAMIGHITYNIFSSK